MPLAESFLEAGPIPAPVAETQMMVGQRLWSPGELSTSCGQGELKAAGGPRTPRGWPMCPLAEEKWLGIAGYLGYLAFLDHPLLPSVWPARCPALQQ